MSDETKEKDDMSTRQTSKPDTKGSLVAAKHIIEKVNAGTLTPDPAKLAKYIETECGIPYLAAACQSALLLNAVDGEVEVQLRGALAWAGYPEESEGRPS